MLPHKRLIPTSGFSSYLAAHNVVGNMRNWKQMDSRCAQSLMLQFLRSHVLRLSPNRPTINRRCHSSQGMVVNTLSSDRSWRPSQNRIYSNSTRSQRAPIIFKARIPNGPKWSPKSDPERSLLASRAASYPSILSTPTLTRQPTVQYQPANEPSLVVCKSVTGSKRREDIQCTSQRTIVKYDDRYGTTEEEVQGGATIDTVSIPSFTLNSASINVYHAVRTFVEEGVEAHLAENGGEVKEERLPRPLPGTTERVVATQSRMVVPESHGEMLTAKRLVTVVPIDNRAMQPKNPIEKGSNRNTDRVANRPFDQALYPHFEEVEFYARQLLSKPTYYSKAQGFSRTTLIDQELPISESNHIEFVQGLEDENESGKLEHSLIAPCVSSFGCLGISTTHPLGHPPAAFVSVSDVPKPVYPLSETQTSTLEALSPLASTDRVDVHEESSQLEDVDASDESLHGPLGFQIPKAKLREIRQDSLQGTETLWQYTLYRGPGCKKVEVHYSLSKDDSERIARLFLDQEVIGFDIEWNQYASASDGLRENVALVQLASEERIALFHIARYSAGDAPEDLVAPTLQRIMESQDITKAGVAIKADCTRLRRYMRIDSRGLLELSHLYKLVKYSTGDVKNINKKLVKLAQQVEEHLKLPLWKGEVRCSDWTKKLDHKQIECRVIPSESEVMLILYRCGVRFIRRVTAFLRLGGEKKGAFSFTSSAKARGAQPPNSARKQQDYLD